MRPRIGKVPHWDKVTPSEQKELDRLAKKWVVIKYVNVVNSVNTWGYEERLEIKAMEDGNDLRWSVNHHPTAEIVMEKLSEHDARMWAKMMK